MKLNWLFFSGIRAKIILLASIGIIGLLLVAGVNRFLDASMIKDTEVGRKGQEIVRLTLQGILLEEKYINTGDKALLTILNRHVKDRQGIIPQIIATATDEHIIRTAEGIGKNAENHARIFSDITDNLAVIDRDRNAISEVLLDISGNINQVVDAITMNETELMMEGELLDQTQVALRDELKVLMSTFDQKLLNVQNLFVFADTKRFEKTRESLSEKIDRTQSNISPMLSIVNSDQYSNIWRHIGSELPKVEALETSVFTEWRKNRGMRPALSQSGEDIQQAALDIVALTEANIADSKKIVSTASLTSAAVALFLLLTLSYVIIRSITRPLNEAIDGLKDGAQKVSETSSQIASSSQSLADGSSQQAASLEETSSSLEEMETVTRQNAENASQADTLMQKACEVVAAANDSMNQLTSSMGEITAASNETSKVVKTIDEIAFQTNLLALNAAVEAARAGEAGAGFAVVADEVRNLAMRAAEAAKTTADLIDASARKVKDGAVLVENTNQGFAAVSDSASQAATLVGEIASASREQSQGIQQINTAVTDIDRVTQQNAAGSEESAAAAEKMNSQAANMLDLLHKLMRVVSGLKNEPVLAGGSFGPGQSPPTHATLPAGELPARTPQKPKALPQQMISHDEKEFTDF